MNTMFKQRQRRQQLQCLCLRKQCDATNAIPLIGHPDSVQAHLRVCGVCTLREGDNLSDSEAKPTMLDLCGSMQGACSTDTHTLPTAASPTILSL